MNRLFFSSIEAFKLYYGCVCMYFMYIDSGHSIYSKLDSLVLLYLHMIEVRVLVLLL